MPSQQQLVPLIRSSRLTDDQAIAVELATCSALSKGYYIRRSSKRLDTDRMPVETQGRLQA